MTGPTVTLAVVEFCAQYSACLAHESQNAATDFYPKYHVKMHEFRGLESGFRLAEGFRHHDQSPVGGLPG